MTLAMRAGTQLGRAGSTMTSATQSYHNRVAVVFDFDLTLAPGTLDALLRRCGLAPEEWKRGAVQPLRDQGWEEVLATIYALTKLSTSGPARITRDLMASIGRELPLFEGVPEMFDRLRRRAHDIKPDLRVEYYLVSSGFLDIMRATSIAPVFEAMWGTELHFSETGALAFPKLIVTHPEKVRYILALAKGLDPKGANAPAHVFRDVPEEERHLPLDQLIYVGDGRSDMPVFRLLSERGGLAIGVFKPESSAEEWELRKDMDARRHVQNLAPADYREGSELTRSLELALDSIAHMVALRGLGRGE